MFIIIARIRSDKKVRASFTHDEAYRIFDTKTKKIKDVPRKTVVDAVKKGTKIKGLKTCPSTVGIIREKGSYSLNDIPFIDGYGNLINPEDARKLVVYGYKGFAEAKKFCVIDYKGKTDTYNISSFHDAIAHNNIIGAKLVNDRISVCKDLYNEVA